MLLFMVANMAYSLSPQKVLVRVTQSVYLQILLKVFFVIKLEFLYFLLAKAEVNEF